MIHLRWAPAMGFDEVLVRGILEGWMEHRPDRISLKDLDWRGTRRKLEDWIKHYDVINVSQP